jgi:hypothetical protein
VDFEFRGVAERIDPKDALGQTVGDPGVRHQVPDNSFIHHSNQTIATVNRPVNLPLRD